MSTVLTDGAGREAFSVVPLAAIHSLLYYASRAPAGAICEIGVYRGGTAFALSSLGRRLYLYDTFEGIPYQGDLDTGNPVGKFADTSAQDVQALIPAATVVQGLFPDSLIPMDPIAFVHADADQYESTKAILEHMPQRMVRGGFILFDDFGVEDCKGCTQAVIESGVRFSIIHDTGKALVVI